MIGDRIPTATCPDCTIVVQVGPAHICPAKADDRARRRKVAMRAIRRTRVKRALRTLGRA